MYKKPLVWLLVVVCAVWPVVTQPLYAAAHGTDRILASRSAAAISVTNPTDEVAEVRFVFLRRGEVNAAPAAFADTIAPGATRVYDNAAERLFGASGSAGVVRVVSSRGLLVSSGFPADLALARGESGVLQGAGLREAVQK